MNDWSCGLSVNLHPSSATAFFAANSCQNASSAIGLPSPFDPGTSTTMPRREAVSLGVQNLNSALSKLAPGGTVSSRVWAWGDVRTVG